jgi:hypothetical protein
VNPNGLGRLSANRVLLRFGTVRPRVQIPGPRPKIVFRIETLPASPTPPCHRGGHRFSRNSAAAAPVQVDCGRRLNSLTAIAQPIYQHAHGPGTVRHLLRKSQAGTLEDAQRRTVRPQVIVPSPSVDPRPGPVFECEPVLSRRLVRWDRSSTRQTPPETVWPSLSGPKDPCRDECPPIRCL